MLNAPETLEDIETLIESTERNMNMFLEKGVYKGVIDSRKRLIELREARDRMTNVATV